MKISLYQRLALSVTLAFVLVGYLFYWWTGSLAQYSQVQAEQKLHIGLAEHLAHDNPLLQDGVYDKSALENLFHTLMVLGPAFEFYFLDPDGKILTYSAKPDKIKRQSIDLAPLNQLIAAPSQVPVFGDDPRHNSRQKIFSASPVYKGENLQGYLYVIIGGEQYDSVFASVKQDNQLLKNIAWFGSALLLLLALLLTLFRSFTAPIRALAYDMDAIKQANFDQNKVSINHWGKNNNEVHQLGNNFVDLVNQLNQQFDLLKHNDKIRRELLAHLSHDLRTPLAAIKGYIETLNMKNEELDADLRKNYIATVMRNVEQLKLLIDQIFELAHLEDGQVSVHLETFPIGELLHDIVAKFALKAQTKKITLSLDPKHCQQVVYSDIAKLERIFSNLIDNALRHTPINGEIRIELTEDNGNLTVSVIDNGSGINDKDISYIFDARYRASNATESKGKHAGLGLAICKRLSQILSSELAVKSQLGKGSEFYLCLSSTSR